MSAASPEVDVGAAVVGAAVVGAAVVGAAVVGGGAVAGAGAGFPFEPPLAYKQMPINDLT